MSLLSKFKGSRIEVRLNRGSRSEVIKGVIIDGDESVIELKSKRSVYLIPLSNIVAIKVLKR